MSYPEEWINGRTLSKLRNLTRWARQPITLQMQSSFNNIYFPRSLVSSTYYSNIVLSVERNTFYFQNKDKVLICFQLASFRISIEFL